MTAIPYIKSVDTRGLSDLMGSIAHIFYQRGATPTMIQRFVQTEAGQLASTACDMLGPKDYEKAIGHAESNVKTFLNSDFSEQAGEKKYTVFERPSQFGSSYTGWHWLTAGPHFLLGVKDEDYHPEAGGAEAIKMLRDQQARGNSRGKAYVRLGKVNSKQSAMHLNRTRVSRAGMASASRYIFDKIGEAKATFAATALKLLHKKRMPPWVRNKIPAVEENGKTIFDDTGLNDAGNPSISFGSAAPGVVSNPVMAGALADALKSREAKAAANLRKLIDGAIYDLNTGRIYKPKDSDFEPEEGWI